MARTYLHARWLCFWMAFFGRNDFHDFSGSARGDSGIPVYPKKICQNTQNSSKYTQNYTQVYFIPEIQRKWYTEYPYLSCNIPYTRFKKPLYTVYPKPLADPDLQNHLWCQKSLSQSDTCPRIHTDSSTFVFWVLAQALDPVKGNYLYSICCLQWIYILKLRCC